MRDAGKLTVKALGDREIVIVREFKAPRQLVFDAFTKAELVRRWLFGPEGWSFAVCEIDLRVGGAYRYVWRKESTGETMGMGGVFREITPPGRLVSTERFDDPWYPGEGVGTIELVEQRGKTLMTQTVRYESRAARDAVLQSPMESGLAAGYDRLETLLATV